MEESNDESGRLTVFLPWAFNVTWVNGVVACVTSSMDESTVSLSVDVWDAILP